MIQAWRTNQETTQEAMEITLEDFIHNQEIDKNEVIGKRANPV